jgi:hypothetical protein
MVRHGSVENGGDDGARAGDWAKPCGEARPPLREDEQEQRATGGERPSADLRVQPAGERAVARNGDDSAGGRGAGKQTQRPAAFMTPRLEGAAPP